jgi:hypothetical protein
VAGIADFTLPRTGYGQRPDFSVNINTINVLVKSFGLRFKPAHLGGRSYLFNKFLINIY